MNVKDYKFSIGELVPTKSGYFKILNQIRKNRKFRGAILTEKGYEYQCMACNYIGTTSECNLIKRQGCSLCNNRLVIKGINDIATTNPELIKYFPDIEYTYTHTYATNIKTTLVCPECGTTKQMSPNKLYFYGFTCDKCNDKFSFPNKFMFAFLRQIDSEFETEKKFYWSNNKKYDFYIPSLNCIIEVHGEQHYRGGFERMGRKGKNCEEEQENDKLKEKLAKENGIENYIVIDASTSSIKYIKNSILNSHLTEIIDVNNIKWEEVGEYCGKNLVKTVCDLWNDGVKSTTEIMKVTGLSRQSCIKYLNLGKELKWCDYTLEISNKYRIDNIRKSNNIKIICLTTGIIYNSINDASRETSCMAVSISSCCRGRYKTSKGLNFLYLSDYEELIAIYKNINLSEDIKKIRKYLKDKYNFK